MVSFKVTKQESDTIDLIVDRIEKLNMLTGWYDRQCARMDLAATHANGNPMDFAKLLAADDFNFAHDISGIANTIDRETGKLTNLFSPRCSRHEPLAA